MGPTRRTPGGSGRGSGAGRAPGRAGGSGVPPETYAAGEWVGVSRPALGGKVRASGLTWARVRGRGRVGPTTFLIPKGVRAVSTPDP